MSTRDETTVSEQDVRTEHLAAVRVGPHWAYLFGVLGFGLLGMLALIAFLGGVSG